MITRRFRRRLLGLTAALMLGLTPVGAAAEAAPVTVFAAASLKTAMDAVADRFEAETGHPAVLSYAGSSALARQIQHGAPADVFVSANREWMDRLAADGLIDPATRTDLLGNRLVLVAHGRDAAPLDLGSELEILDSLGEGRLAMALVEAVPAGIYGKAALTTLGLWEALAPRIAQADNARAALALVAAGEAPLGIVYATDALAADTLGERVTVVARFPADSHPSIVYPAAAVARRDTPLAARFLAFLRGPAARAAFERQGFMILAPGLSPAQADG